MLDPVSHPRTDKVAAPRVRAGAAKARVVLVQTQAEAAGAQEISRILGAGLTAQGYEVHYGQSAGQYSQTLSRNPMHSSALESARPRHCGWRGCSLPSSASSSSCSRTP